MAVYLLHIDPPLRHSKHYVGYTSKVENVEERVRRHQNGTGGALPREAVKQGSTITLVHVWPTANRKFERYVKRHGGATRWCPRCGVMSRRMPEPAIQRLTEHRRRSRLRKQDTPSLECTSEQEAAMT